MKKVDERDTMFARVNYKKESVSYNDYYSRHPEKKIIDDSIRSRPNLCSSGTATFNELNSPMASCAFDFLSDIKSLCEKTPSTDKIQVDPHIITKKIKGLSKQYGAKLVGITKLMDYHLYSHRGRHEDVYGNIVNLNHKYAIVFAVEMQKDMINRGPMISEIIETSKCYVDASIIGMILTYYITSLGYEARNHMDANYLLMPVLVAKDAGLGEIGRNTMLTTKDYGSRIRLGVVTTNLNLEVDTPITFGLDDFCKECNNCAHVCPSKAISRSENVNEWLINQENCYTRWTYFGTDCGMCIASCPFSQQMQIIKDTQTFKDNIPRIQEVLYEFKQKYGRKPLVPGHPEWLK